jgi:hypothetical protein
LDLFTPFRSDPLFGDVRGFGDNGEGIKGGEREFDGKEEIRI